jgi:hypothetical protein
VAAEIDVPHAVFSGPRYDRMVNFFQSNGASHAYAVEQSQARCLEVFAYGWNVKAQKTVKYWEKVYHEWYGDTEGFDAQTVAGLYVPGANAIYGKRGNFHMKNALRGMR